MIISIVWMTLGWCSTDPIDTHVIGPLSFPLVAPTDAVLACQSFRVVLGRLERSLLTEFLDGKGLAIATFQQANDTTRSFPKHREARTILFTDITNVHVRQYDEILIREDGNIFARVTGRGYGRLHAILLQVQTTLPKAMARDATGSSSIPGRHHTGRTSHGARRTRVAILCGYSRSHQAMATTESLLKITSE